MNFRIKKDSKLDTKNGLFVRSKAGRDKGRYFIVYEFSNNYVYLIDGDLRKISKPKKKKDIHVAKTRSFIENFDDLKNDDCFNDRLIRKMIDLYKNKEDS